MGKKSQNLHSRGNITILIHDIQHKPLVVHRKTCERSGKGRVPCQCPLKNEAVSDFKGKCLAEEASPLLHMI